VALFEGGRPFFFVWLFGGCVIVLWCDLVLARIARGFNPALPTRKTAAYSSEAVLTPRGTGTPTRCWDEKPGMLYRMAAAPQRCTGPHGIRDNQKATPSPRSRKFVPMPVSICQINLRGARPLARFVLCLVFAGWFPLAAAAQCDTVAVPKSGWSLVAVSSADTATGPAAHAFDDSTHTFWHSRSQDTVLPYPHELVIDLGAAYRLWGWEMRPRQSAPYDGKIERYELFSSADGLSWGQPATGGQFYYTGSNDRGARQQFFGPVTHRYVKLVALAGYQGDPSAALAELTLFATTTCPDQGLQNQYLLFDPLPEMTTDDPPLALSATSNAGLPVSYNIVSGPATVSGDTLLLTGAAGTVTVKASQSGNAQYYPAPDKYQTFEVVDLHAIYPELTLRMHDSGFIQMPQLATQPIYALTSIDEPDFLSVKAVTITVNGDSLPVIRRDNAWEAWWKAPHYGGFRIIVTAIASHGNRTADTLNVNVTPHAQDTVIRTFDHTVINFNGSGASQWAYATYLLPQFTGAYDSIGAYLDITCPNVSGGCDDWDRLAYIQVKDPAGEWIELIRYITPYGVGCDHRLDVTDFLSLLQGKVDFRMYISTWGSGGWEITLDLAYRAGAPRYPYSRTDRLWYGNYPFGNLANLQPLDTLRHHFAPGADSAALKIVTTGHGWGNNNTDNAAEFYHALHHVYVSDLDTFAQDLWRNCSPNPDGCHGQQGTWAFDRAGWCPGAISPGYDYDLTPLLAYDSVELRYIFDKNYVDWCHPSNPNCVSQQTCPNCHDGFNPQYEVAATLLTWSDEPIILPAPLLPSGRPASPHPLEAGLSLRVRPNPAGDFVYLEMTPPITRGTIQLRSLDGRLLLRHRFTPTLHIAHLPAGLYFIQVKAGAEMAVGKVVKGSGY